MFRAAKIGNNCHWCRGIKCFSGWNDCAGCSRCLICRCLQIWKYRWKVDACVCNTLSVACWCGLILFKCTEDGPLYQTMQDAIEGYRFDVPQGWLTGDVYLEEWQFFPFKHQDKTHLIISFFAPRIAILPCCQANFLITRLLWAWQSFVLGLYLPYIAIKTTIFKGFRGLLEHFWVQKTESIEQKCLFSAQCLVISVFFSLFANEIRGTFRNYVPTQCQIRPDVVPDTSRRSIKYIPT